MHDPAEHGTQEPRDKDAAGEESERNERLGDVISGYLDVRHRHDLSSSRQRSS
jgi:hypothetical protein